MGFLQALGRLLTPKSAMNSWKENMTEEQLNDLERQGCDVTELRRELKERIAREQQAKQLLHDNSMAMLDMNKLTAYLATPRDPESEFMKDVTALGKLSGKSKDKMKEAPIVYGAVVQAHHALWEPGNNDDVGVVFLFAMDKEHMHNAEWLRGMASKISQLKEGGSIPPDCQKFIATLCDSQSMFCFKVGESISEGADLWCATFTWEKQASTLPGGYLPATRIVPLMLMESPEVNQFAWFKKIPTKYYTK